MPGPKKSSAPDPNLSPDDMVALERLARRADPTGTLVRAWPLAGGVSARVLALEVMLPGEKTVTLAIRIHGDRDLARNPNLAADELRLLQMSRCPAMRPCQRASRTLQ